MGYMWFIRSVCVYWKNIFPHNLSRYSCFIHTNGRTSNAHSHIHTLAHACTQTRLRTHSFANFSLYSPLYVNFHSFSPPVPSPWVFISLAVISSFLSPNCHRFPSLLPFIFFPPLSVLTLPTLPSHSSPQHRSADHVPSWRKWRSRKRPKLKIICQVNKSPPFAFPLHTMSYFLHISGPNKVHTPGPKVSSVNTNGSADA